MGTINTSLTPPSQQRTIDPYSENRYSSVINRFTRIVTGGKNVILHGDKSFIISIIDIDNLQIGPGIAVKDDALIHITEDYIMNFKNINLYMDEEGGMTSEGWYFIVLFYNYSRSLPAPKAYYKIIRDSQVYNNDRTNYIYLANIYVKSNITNNGYEIDLLKGVHYIHPTDPDIHREAPQGILITVDGGII